MSFLADKVVSEGLTFDDVLLIPSYSEILPREVDLTSWFTRNIRLNMPIVTAAMDTVTDSRMAIAIAREGGIGVIHKNMTISEQAHQVTIVKRAENGMIYDPVTISKEKTVREAIELMKNYKIGGIPVIDDNGCLVGIVTNRDLRFECNMNKLISEIMTSENLITTNASTSLELASEILQKYKIEKLPVVDKNNKLIALVTYKDITKAKDKPLASKDEKGRLRVAAAVGITADTMDRIDELVNAQVDAIVIDTAHGHSKNVLNMLRKAKNKYPEIDFVAGNIATSRSCFGYGTCRCRRCKSRNWPRIDLHHTSNCRSGYSSAFGNLQCKQSHQKNRSPGNCRWRHSLFRRYCKSTRCRSSFDYGRIAFCRSGRISR